jgi:hypothetical protein
MVALTVIWLCLWAAAEWKQRRMFVVGLAATMALLLVASEVLFPHWLFYFIAATRDYIGYTQGKSALAALFTPVGGVVLTILLVFVLARIWWKSRHEPANSPAFGLTTAVTLCVTLVVIPENVPHLQVILLPALLWLWFENDAARLALTGILRRVPFLLLAWSWVTALALDLLARWLPARPSVWVVLPLLGAGDYCPSLRWGRFCRWRGRGERPSAVPGDPRHPPIPQKRGMDGAPPCRSRYSP